MFKTNLALLGKADIYTGACRFPSFTAATHKATIALACSEVVIWTSMAK